MEVVEELERAGTISRMVWEVRKTTRVPNKVVEKDVSRIGMIVFLEIPCCYSHGTEDWKSSRESTVKNSVQICVLV